MAIDKIVIKGARQHNLKNINLEIPKNKFVVVTGISGSGKSSLAFDTIYAEGQRRYVESLSAYARQFLGVMDKPDVDSIEGLSPSISIDQKAVSQNPRSTVGTITEIYDYFRLLYARIGHPHCPKCGAEVSKLSLDEIVKKILVEVQTHVASHKPSPTNFALLSPIVRQKKGEFKELFVNLQSKGYQKARIDGKLINLKEEIVLLKQNKHNVEAIVDEFSVSLRELRDPIFSGNLKTRITAGAEQSLKLSDGLVVLQIGDKQPSTKNLEHLFSEKFSCPVDNISLPELEPRMFSFNSPLGACPVCNGIGAVFKIDPTLILNPTLSVAEGGIKPFFYFFSHETWYTRLIRTVAKEEGVNLEEPIGRLPKEKMDILLKGTGKTYSVSGKNRFGHDTTIHERFDGILAELERHYLSSQSPDENWEIRRYMREEVCAACRGQRLRPEALAVTVEGFSVAQVADFAVLDLKDYFPKLQASLNSYEQEIAKPIFKEIQTRLSFLDNVGLSYLTISRPARTLSGGELQRIRLASQIGTGLTGVLYVLDEPSIGLHPRDMAALIATLKNLRDLGNTLLVVEHDRETMESADHLIELGPGAGREGGKVVFEGTLAQIKKRKDSLTGQFLSGRRKIALEKRPLNQNLGRLILSGATEHNLKNIDTEIPLGNLVVVTGVSGSGKSTLVVETLYPALKYQLTDYFPDRIGKFKNLTGFENLDRVYLVDQSPIGRTPRSNPATYVGFFDDIRDLFAQTIEARAKGFKKGRFSFNVRGGRCEKCEGAGVIKIEMQFLADVYVTCDVCNGRRYNEETLEVKYKGKAIDEVLQMTVEEAVEFFAAHPALHRKLALLQEVGLGYITLGQGAPTFSGGEAQRIKLVNELSRGGGNTLYILDEPTTGLHFADIEKLLHTLYELVERENTVLVIEHNPEIIKNSQWIIDLGPEGGDKGGQVVYQGELKGILKAKESYTGIYLKKHLS